MLETTGTEHEITGGVDTHTAAALDGLGHLLGHQWFPTTVAGYADRLTWLTSWGPVVAVGIERTGSTARAWPVT
jgi:transposase